MFTLLFLLPFALCTLALVGAALLAWALPASATYVPESTMAEAEAWATDLEWELMAAPEAPCPVMAALVALRVVADPWVVAAPAALAARMGVPTDWLVLSRAA